MGTGADLVKLLLKLEFQGEKKFTFLVQIFSQGVTWVNELRLSCPPGHRWVFTKGLKYKSIRGIPLKMFRPTAQGVRSSTHLPF